MNDLQEAVCFLLNELNIEYELIEHQAVFTVEEASNLNMDACGKGTKNLFLRDKKKTNYYIIVFCEEKRADLKKLQSRLASRPLTFASEESLYEILKLQKGAVTPFGVLNNIERDVQVIFDEDLFAFDKIGAHPNVNTATVWLSPYDLKKAIEKNGNETKVLVFD
jgi:Ala-tRNA(Pro) deacylase